MNIGVSQLPACPIISCSFYIKIHLHLTTTEPCYINCDKLYRLYLFSSHVDSTLILITMTPSKSVGHPIILNSNAITLRNCCVVSKLRNWDEILFNFICSMEIDDIFCTIIGCIPSLLHHGPTVSVFALHTTHPIITRSSWLRHLITSLR